MFSNNARAGARTGALVGSRGGARAGARTGAAFGGWNRDNITFPFLISYLLFFFSLTVFIPSSICVLIFN